MLKLSQRFKVTQILQIAEISKCWPGVWVWADAATCQGCHKDLGESAQPPQRAGIFNVSYLLREQVLKRRIIERTGIGWALMWVWWSITHLEPLTVIDDLCKKTSRGQAFNGIVAHWWDLWFWEKREEKGEWTCGCIQSCYLQPRAPLPVF